MENYWKFIFERAWDETKRTLNIVSWTGAIFWAITTTMMIAGLILWGSADSASDEFITRMLLISIVIVAVPLVFAYKFFAETANAYQDLREWTKELEATIIQTQNADEAISGISERYQKGLSLFRQETETWLSDMKAWEAEFDEYVRQKFSAGFSYQVSVIDQIEYRTVQRGNSRPAIEISPPKEGRTYYAAKMSSIQRNIPYAETYYRGDIKGLPAQYGSIRVFGLAENRRPV